MPNQLSRNEFLTGLVPLQTLPEGSEEECPICAEEFSNPVQLPCSHIYCQICIDKWLHRKGKNSCPTCRRELFVVNEDDRGPVGVDRLQIVARALEHSRLLTGEFDVYDHEIDFSVSEIHRAAAAANNYLAEGNHAPSTGPALIDIQSIGPHIIAMGNMMRGYARATGRGYSRYQRRDWKIIVDRLITTLRSVNGEVRSEQLNHMSRDIRIRIRRSLEDEGLDIDSGRFFDRDAEVDSTSGDLDVLLNYVVFQCTKAYAERQRRRAAHRQAQEDALQRETTRFGRALRLTGQRLFGGV